MHKLLDRILKKAGDLLGKLILGFACSVISIYSTYREEKVLKGQIHDSATTKHQEVRT